MNVLRSLRHRPFALLWAVQTTSRFGDSMHRAGLVGIGKNRLGPRPGRRADGLLLGGIGTIALTLIGLLHPAIRGLD